MGGVGNRLFQLARAVDLRRAGRMPVLIEVQSVFGLELLTSRFMGWTVHPIWLDLVQLAADLGIEYRRPTVREQFGLLVELVRIRGMSQPQRLNIPLDHDHRSAQIGYFQHPGCISTAALQELVTRLDLMLERPAAQPDCVIHIRGGDFALNDRIDPKTVADFVRHSGRPTVCVTNDPKFVRDVYPDVTIHPSKSALEDFTTIARASEILPSNSTFCFWACAVATLVGDANLAPGQRDPYWQMLSARTGAVRD